MSLYKKVSLGYSLMEKNFLLILAVLGVLLLPRLSFAKTFQVDSSSTLVTGLLSYYQLEDATEYFVGGGTYDLTNGGSTPFNSGKVSKAADGGSSNSAKLLYADSNAGGDLTYAQSVTAWSVSLWVKLNSSQSGGTIWRTNVNNGSSRRRTFALILQSSVLKFELYDGSLDLYSTGQTLSTGTWYHVVTTYDGSTIKMYVNNSNVLTQNRSTSYAPDTTNGFGILADRESGANYDYLNGMVDELGLWSKVLSATEISDLYNGGSGQTMTNSGLDLFSLNQYKSDATTPINNGSSTTESYVTFGATVSESEYETED
jgi:hypothetical protein